MRRTILAAALAFAAVTPTAEAAQWTREPDGRLTCPGSYPVYRWNGQIVIVCPPDPITPQRRDDLLRQYNARVAAEAAHMDELSRRNKASERAGILKTCARPDPSINTAWCANEIARLNKD
jgi:hypothetical protein